MVPSTSHFGFLLHKGNGPVEADVVWPSSGSIHPKTVTAWYAGMLAMAFYCASYRGEDEYLEGSKQDDLEKIDALLLRLSPHQQ
jgi:hypothetical protein